MRAVLLAVVVAFAVALSCGPKVDPRGPDDDLDVQDRAPRATPRELGNAERTVAEPGKGLRTGTVSRNRLVAVLDAGPAMFLRQFEVAPRLKGKQFVGWQLVQVFDRSGPLGELDLVPGDVLLAVNGRPVARPEQVQTVWDSLRTANDVVAQLWRGDQKLELHFRIEPAVR